MPKERDKFTPFEQPRVGALSLRAAIRGEIYPIAVTTASKTFNVPAAWKGAIVAFHADGGDLYYQISTDASNVAAVALAARATEANNPIDLTAAATGCIPILNGTFRELQFPAGALTFALIGSVACVARTHLAET
jgi:hypothetical protein